MNSLFWRLMRKTYRTIRQDYVIVVPHSLHGLSIAIANNIVEFETFPFFVQRLNWTIGLMVINPWVLVMAITRASRIPMTMAIFQQVYRRFGWVMAGMLGISYLVEVLVNIMSADDLQFGNMWGPLFFVFAGFGLVVGLLLYAFMTLYVYPIIIHAAVHQWRVSPVVCLKQAVHLVYRNPGVTLWVFFNLAIVSIVLGLVGFLCILWLPLIYIQTIFCVVGGIFATFFSVFSWWAFRYVRVISNLNYN
jgi:hypothetical protein